MASPASAPSLDRSEINHLVEKLESDLAQVRDGSGDADALRAEIAQLRSALADRADHDAVSAALRGLHQRLGSFGDELFGDALTSGHYIAWMGRILGM